MDLDDLMHCSEMAKNPGERLIIQSDLPGFSPSVAQQYKAVSFLSDQTCLPQA